MEISTKSIWGVIACFTLVSCEEVIDLDLGSAEPRIVIEGIITTGEGPYPIEVKESVDYSETNVFPPVTGAKVTLSSEDGLTEVLEEVNDGVYLIRDLRGENGKTYSLEVDQEGEVYQASSTLPKTTVPLQALSYTYNEESIFIEEGYYLTAYFADPVDEVNYYRLKIFVNGKPYYFERGDDLVKDDNFWLINDKFFNGKLMDFEFPHKLKPGDKVDVELHQVDRTTYDYYRTLVELMGLGGVAPSNPLTNWSNGALGYFGAVSVTRASTTIKEE